MTRAPVVERYGGRGPSYRQSQGWTLLLGSMGGSAARRGKGSLRGLVNVRPQGRAGNACHGFNALGEFDPRLANAGKYLVQKRRSNSQCAGQRGLRQGIVSNVC